MGNRLAVAMLLASFLVPGRAAPLQAQAGARRTPVPEPLAALALHDLSFGTVLRGIPSSVSVHDPRHAALFEIRGAADASVRVEFILPSALAAADGALLPVSFGPQDGYADFSRGRPPRGLVFNPQASVIGSLGPNGRLFLRLGGTVLPSRTQAGGTYRATIYMTVYDLGS